MRVLRQALGAAVACAILLALALILWAAVRGHPEDLPWTPLDLSRPVGAFTGRKLAALHGEGPRCRALLARARVRYSALAPLRAGPHCGYDDAVRFSPDGARSIAFVPAGVGMACPVAAAISVWEWNVVQPAALARFGARVTRIDHFGSYNCRRIAGRETAGWSEHAHADAIDIAGFRLADGTRTLDLGRRSVRRARWRLPPVRDHAVARLQCGASRPPAPRPSAARRTGLARVPVVQVGNAAASTFSTQ